MSPTDSDPSWADHAAGARRLARALVFDPDRAEDVAQESLRIAWERPPAAGRSSRSWLAGIVRNVARNTLRGDRRRREREQAVADRRSASPSPDDLVVRLETQRRAIDAVLSLEEPYRSTVILRYFEDLSPPAIAARQGVPIETVHTRLRRGLARVRVLLDASEGGDRRRWTLALWPRDVRPAPVGPGVSATVGALVVKKTVVAVAALLVLAVGGWWAFDRLERAGREPRGEPVAGVAPAAGDPGADARAPRLAGEAADSPPGSVPRAAGAPARRGAVVVLVEDPTGRPVPGALVEAGFERGVVRTKVAVARTGADGRCVPDLSALEEMPAMQRAAGRLVLVVRAAHHQTKRDEAIGYPRLARESSEGPIERRIVLSPGGMLRGRVLGADGRPAPGAEARLLATGEDWGEGGDCEEDGRFEILIQRSGPHRLVGFAPPSGVAVVSDLVLDPAADAEVPTLYLVGPGWIEGVARYPDGRPAADLAVYAWAESIPNGFGTSVKFSTSVPPAGLRQTFARTGADGRFRLSGLEPGRYVVSHRLDAKAGPDTVHATGDSGVALPVGGHRIVLRVVDEDGRPVPGASYRARWPETDDVATGTLTDANAMGDFWASAGRRIVIGAGVEGSLPAESEIRVPEEPFESVVTAVLRPRDGRTGTVRMRLSDAYGAPIDAAEVTVWTPMEVDIVLVLSSTAADGAHALPPLPVGDYLLEVVPGRGGKSAAPIEPWFPIKAPMTVRAGEETRLDLTARSGGHVRLRVRVPPDAAWPGRELSVKAVRSSDGEPVRLGAFVTPQEGGYRISGLQRDEAGVNVHVLEPGGYRLRFEAPGFRTAETAVDVPAGGIAEVDVTLSPE